MRNNNICTVDNCGRYAPHATPKRCCNMHFRRWWRYGTFEYVRQGKRRPNKSGYILIGKNGKQQQEHRLIMEEHLGRKLLPFPIETVHHINGIRSDNRIENLVVISQAEHVKIHDPIKPYRFKKGDNRLVGKNNPRSNG